jgi:sulfur carrier protein
VIVVVNGEHRQLPNGTTIAALLEQLSAPERGVAVAVDGEVVPRGHWAATSLPEGAQVEVVAAIQGG